MASASPYIDTWGESATLHTRVLGGRNPVTRFPAVTWTDSTITLLLQEAGTSERETPAGRVSEKRYNGFVASTVTVSHMDRVTVDSVIYEVVSTPTTVYLDGSASFKKLELMRVSI